MNLRKTVTIAAAGALTALAIPAMASEFNFYGSARMSTFWNTVDTKAAGINKGSTTDFDEHMNATSRLGVNATNGDMTGKIEIGLKEGGNGLYTRLMYGSYKFGFGKVLLGQDYNNYYLISNQVALDDNVNNNYGSLWDGRQPQIKVTLDNGLYFSAIQPSTNTSGGNNAANENYLPKLNVGYEGKAGNFAFGAGVVGQAFKQTVAAAGAVPELNDSVTSLLGYFHGTLKLDALELKANIGVGQNTGDMGFTNANATATNKYVSKTATSSGKDTTSYEGYIQASYTLSPALKLNAAFGYAADDNDTYYNTDNRMQVYVNAPIMLGKGFSVTPEITYQDQLDQAGTKGGTKPLDGDKSYIVGAKWQMDF